MWFRRRVRPKLSVIIVVYDMAREAARTLHSLSAEYQRNAAAEDYEVIVVDNGSPVPFAEENVQKHGGSFRYLYLDDPPPSPAFAVNLGVRQSSGENVGIMVDGARIVTPGLIENALTALSAFRRPVVSTIAFHLGPDVQNRSIAEGYDRKTEDRLLDSIGWPGDGYRLFEVAALAGSSSEGWFGPLAESNCVCMPRSLFEELGGFDERFAQPGGGFVNLDFYARACALPDSQLVMLLGEATFHQLHGGTITNLGADDQHRRLVELEDQYEEIVGRRFVKPARKPVFLGSIPPPALPWIERSLDRVVEA